MNLKNLSIGKLLCTMVALAIFMVGPMVQAASAIEIDIETVGIAVDEAVAAGVDRQSAIQNAARDAAEQILIKEKSNTDFVMTQEEIANEIIAKLGGLPMAEPESLLVIDIAPIAAEVDALIAKGVEKEDARQEIVPPIAEQMYGEEIAADPKFPMTKEKIQEEIIAMLDDLDNGDIEAYERTRSRTRRSVASVVVNTPASRP